MSIVDLDFDFECESCACEFTIHTPCLEWDGSALCPCCGSTDVARFVFVLADS
jgi:hypothetical protein